MSKKDEVEVPVVKKLKPEVQALCDKITSGLELDKTNGVISETKSNYIDNLPNGITADVDEKLCDYRTQFVAASANAVGQIALEALAKSKKLDTITAELAMGPKDKVRHAVERERTYNTFGSGNDRKVTVKHGVLSTEVDIKGGHNSGQLKIARDSIAQFGNDKLAGGK